MKVLRIICIAVGAFLVLDTIVVSMLSNFNLGVILPAILGLPLLLLGIFLPQMHAGFPAFLKWFLLGCYALGTVFLIVLGVLMGTAAKRADEVDAVFGPSGPYRLNYVHVDAKQHFYDKLAGASDPEAKRHIIGEEFIRVFEAEAKKIGAVEFLAQGTIYPDVVESGLGGESAVIKSHHNVGGLPEHVDFKEIIEPLRALFKDEVRKVGLELGIPEKLVFRQPFPGPGLGIRIIGEVTEEKVKMVQDADAIFREEVAAAGLDRELNQYFAALTNMRSVGVMGDERTYDYAVCLRAVKTIDFMTAESAEIPWPVLQKVTSRIINEVRHVNRVMYDITSKPPGTIELE